MTTVTYRDGIMAADSRAFSGDRSPIGFKDKVHRLADGTLVGISTTVVGADKALVHWVEKGRLPAATDKLDNFMVLMVKPNGQVFYARDQLLWTGPLSAPFYAIGSGGDYALGALSMGATAVQAVEKAIQMDPWSGGDIVTRTICDPGGLSPGHLVCRQG